MMEGMKRFEGKVVLVTGGNRNTGLDIVERFVREGAKVFMCGSSAASTAKGAETLKDFPALIKIPDGLTGFDYRDSTVDGSDIAFDLWKTGDRQWIPLGNKKISWLRLERLIKSDDPSAFPALTQLELIGKDL